MIGESQIFIDGSTIVTLSWDNFSADFDSELGYIRTPGPLPTVEYTLKSEAVVRALRLGPRFELKWKLWLFESKLVSLSSMLRRQIVLHDMRLSLTERTPRTRTPYLVISDDGAVSTFYPSLNVYISDLRSEPFLFDGTQILYSVDMTAFEL